MTQFIGVEDMRRLVRSTGTKGFLTQLAGYVRSDFSRWSEFEKSARVASHSRDGVIELMPTSDGQLYTFKYVNGHPSNPKTGKLTVTAFGVLADVATGYPLLISEMTLLTALRTAATSAFAATVLARRDSKAMATDRRRGAVGIPGAGIPGDHRYRGSPRLRPRCGRGGQVHGQCGWLRPEAGAGGVGRRGCGAAPIS